VEKGVRGQQVRELVVDQQRDPAAFSEIPAKR
jgi:hypothetical protein